MKGRLSTVMALGDAEAWARSQASKPRGYGNGDGMSDPELEARLRLVLDDLDATGVGTHRHLDEVLGDHGPHLGDRAWVDIARATAAAAQLRSGRYLVVVPLGTSTTLPGTQEIGVITPAPDEPPAVHLVIDHDPQRDWVGEYYRRDLRDSSENLLVYISAFRTLDERAAHEPFAINLYFETRR
jgi:hypothetical protein